MKKLQDYLYDPIRKCNMHTMFATERVDGSESLVTDRNVKEAIHLYEKKHGVNVIIKREWVCNDFWDCEMDFLYEV